MDAGRLRERITIRRKTTTKNATTGAPATTWGDLAASISAEVRSINGREALVGQVLQGVSHFQITIRYRSDVRVSDQIVWLTNANRELNVHSAEDRIGNRQWLTIHASTEAPVEAAS